MPPGGDAARRPPAYARGMSVGRSLVRGAALPVRGLWRGCVAVVRGIAWLAGWSAGAADPRSMRRRRLVLVALAWLAAIGAWGIGFGTAQLTYDVPFSLAPFLGVAVGLPVALIVRRPPPACG